MVLVRCPRSVTGLNKVVESFRTFFSVFGWKNNFQKVFFHSF